MDKLDVGEFRLLMEESQDLQVDAMRSMKEPLDAIVDLGKERRAKRAHARLRRVEVDQGRRRLLAGIGAAGALGVTGAWALPMSSAAAAEDADIMALQTAVSIEKLAIFTYKTALTLPYLQTDKVAIKTVAAFAKMTMAQHTEHAAAFNARAKELGGAEQTETSPKYTPIVQEMLPALKKGGPLDVIALAITLEDVATSTYVQNIQDVEDPQVRLLFGTVVGVESQHLATLYAVQALLKGDAPELVTLKATGDAVNAAKLPAAAGSVGIPETFKKTDLASPPEEGAVK